jgi:hypothetical protein
LIATATASVYWDLLARLGIDLVAIFVCVYAVFYRRHHRRDLVMAYACFNIGLFTVLEVISTQSVTLGVGLGLFGILSIVRLRSEPFSNSEMGYFFVALVLGLLNGLGLDDLLMTGILNAVVVATVFVVDHPKLLTPVYRQRMVLDTVHRSAVELLEDLEDRLGVEIDDIRVIETDYVREITIVEVRHAGKPTGRDPVAVPVGEPALQVMRSRVGE